MVQFFGPMHWAVKAVSHDFIPGTTETRNGPCDLLPVTGHALDGSLVTPQLSVSGGRSPSRLYCTNPPEKANLKVTTLGAKERFIGTRDENLFPLVSDFTRLHVFTDRTPLAEVPLFSLDSLVVRH